MRFFTARSLALATLVPALVLFVIVPGCAKQKEGERCGDTLGAGANEDCGEDLTCKDKNELVNGATDMAHRCCYTDGRVTDSRCEPRPPMVASGGAAAASGTSAGGTSAGGTSAGGTSAGGTSAGGTSAGGGASD